MTELAIRTGPIYLIEENLNNVFVTADDHFGHENIIKYCNRPFETADQMDNVLIDNWNEVVSPQDWVIHLGDFTLGGRRVAREYFEKLNGEICVLSNPWHHDRHWITPPFTPGESQSPRKFKSRSGFSVRIWEALVILEVPRMAGADGRHPLTITLCHYPFATWDRKHYGGWHLHGHSHGNYTGEGYILDVGVDNHNFYPISLATVLENMEKKGWSR